MWQVSLWSIAYWSVLVTSQPLFSKSVPIIPLIIYFAYYANLATNDKFWSCLLFGPVCLFIRTTIGKALSAKVFFTAWFIQADSCIVYSWIVNLLMGMIYTHS